jgi:hypothetical protein
MQRNTFPSGHATAATAIAVGAILVSPLRVRWLVVPLAAGYAALVGHATQIAGWHRLSDAIGGVLLVLAVAGAGVGVLGRTGFVEGTSLGRIHPRILGGLAAAGAAALIIAATLLALPTAFPLLYEPENARRVFLHVAFDLVGVGLTVLAITAFARVLEPLDLGLGSSVNRRGRRTTRTSAASSTIADRRPAAAGEPPTRPADHPGA